MGDVKQGPRPRVPIEAMAAQVFGQPDTKLCRVCGFEVGKGQRMAHRDWCPRSRSKKPAPVIPVAFVDRALPRGDRDEEPQW